MFKKILLIIIIITLAIIFWVVLKKEEAPKLYIFEKISLNENTFDTMKFDPHKAEIKLYLKNDEDEKFKSIKKLSEYLLTKNEKLIFATNGGMFDNERNPIGLFVQDKKEIKKINLNNGPGNFHLKPNGVFAIYENNIPKIITSSEYSTTTMPIYATQSGPMLVINNNIHPEFHEDSENFRIRSGVGVDKDNNIIFAISNEPTTFYNFALLFKENLNCPNALYLDGSISRMYIPDEKRNEIVNSFGVIVGVSE
jgi:uncharacterized protein YigE (DUF2233 family)